MTYKELIPYLHDRHFYPHVILAAGSDTITGLVLDCPVIYSDEKLARVREVLPDGFQGEFKQWPSAIPKGEIGQIHITKIEKNEQLVERRKRRV